MTIKQYNIDGKKILKSAVKLVAGGVVSFGAGFIITRYGKAVILPSDKTIKKLVMVAGATCIASMVGDAASDYVGKQVDECAKLVDNLSIAFSSNDNEEEELANGGC